MNYIFSFNTNDESTFNLIYTSRDKELLELNKCSYLETPYFINLLETIEGEEYNFKIGKIEYFLFQLDLCFSYKQLYSYFIQNIKNIETIELMSYFGDLRLEETCKRILSVELDLNKLNQNVQAYRILFEIYPELYKDFLWKTNLIYNQDENIFQENTKEYFYQKIPRNSYKIYENAIVLNIPVYISHSILSRYYDKQPGDKGYESDDSCMEYCDSLDIAEQNIINFKLFGEIDYYGFSNFTYKYVELQGLDASDLEELDKFNGGDITFNFIIKNIDMEVYIDNIDTIEPDDLIDSNIDQSEKGYNNYDIFLTLKNKYKVEKIRFVKDKFYSQEIQSSDKTVEVDEHSDSDNNSDNDYNSDKKRYESIYCYKLQDKISYVDVDNLNYYEQFVIWLK